MNPTILMFRIIIPLLWNVIEDLSCWPMCFRDPACHFDEIISPAGKCWKMAYDKEVQVTPRRGRWPAGAGYQPAVSKSQDP